MFSGLISRWTTGELLAVEVCDAVGQLDGVSRLHAMHAEGGVVQKGLANQIKLKPWQPGECGRRYQP